MDCFHLRRLFFISLFLMHVKRRFGMKRETSALIPGTIIFAGTMMSQLKVIDLTNSPCYLLTREEKN